MKIRSPLFSEKSAVDRWSSEPSDVVAPAADSCCTVAEDSVLQCLSSHYSIMLVAAGLLFFLIHFIVSKRKKSYLDDLHRDYHRVLREKDSNFHATLQLKDQRIAELQQNLADAVQSSSSSIEKDRSLTSGNSSSLANRLLDEHKLEVSKLVEEYKLQIDQLVDENEVRLGALRTLHNGYVEKLEEDQAATIDALETTHKQTIEQLRSEHQSAMDQLLHSLKSIAPAEKEQYAINLGDPSHALNTKILKITMEELQRELSARCRENVDLNESNARLREELSATSLLVTNGLSFDKIVADGRVAEDRQRRALLDLISLCRTTTNPTADATGDNVLATQDGRMINAIGSSDSCGTDIGSHHDEGDGSPSLQEVTSQLENEILSLRAHTQELRQSRRANAALKFQLAAASSPSKRKGSSLALALSELQKQHGLCTKQLQKHRHCLLAMHRKLLSVDTAVSNSSSSSSSIVQRGRGSDESSWYDAMFEKIDARLDLLIQQLAPSRAPIDDRLRSITYDTHFDASTSSSNSSSSDAAFTDGLHEVSSSSALSVPFLSLSLASLNDELSSCKLQLQTVTDESQLHRELLEQCRDSLSTATRQLADLTADNQQLADSLDKAEIHINELKVSVTSLGRERVELLRDKQQLSMETEKAKAESESLFRTELAVLERTLQGRILERDTLVTSLRERVHQCEMLLTIAERSLEEKIEATRRGLLDQNMAYLEQYKSDEAKLCQEKDGLRHLLELSEATRLQLLERVESMEFELRELKGGSNNNNNNRSSRSSRHASSSSSSPVTRKEEYLSRIQDLQIRVEQLLDDNAAKDSIILQQQLQTQCTSKSSSTGDIIIIDDSKDIIIEEQAEQLNTVRADLEKVISTYQLKEKAYSRKDSLLVELEVVCGILVVALIFSWVYA